MDVLEHTVPGTRPDVIQFQQLARSLLAGPQKDDTLPGQRILDLIARANHSRDRC
jgi:hypothetical protein